MIKEVFNNLAKEKKETILLAAKIEFVKNGFLGTKVTSICKNANIPRSAFYRYFDSLEDIFEMVIKHFLVDRVMELQNTIRKNPNSIFDTFREMLINALDSKDDILLIESLSLYHKNAGLTDQNRDMFQSLPHKTNLIRINFMCIIKDFVKLHQKQGIPKDFILKQYDDLTYLIKKGYDNI